MNYWLQFLRNLPTVVSNILSNLTYYTVLYRRSENIGNTFQYYTILQNSNINCRYCTKMQIVTECMFSFVPCVGLVSYQWQWEQTRLRRRAGIWSTWRLSLTWKQIWRDFLLNPDAPVVSCYSYSSVFLTPYRPANWHTERICSLGCHIKTRWDSLYKVHMTKNIQIYSLFTQCSLTNSSILICKKHS